MNRNELWKESGFAKDLWIGFRCQCGASIK